MKNKILILTRWIVGVFLILLATFGAFGSGDFILGSIVLFGGLWLIPLIPKMIKKLLKGGLRINIPDIKLPLPKKKFINGLDIINDTNLTATIDEKLKSTDKIFDKNVKKSIGKNIIEQLLFHLINMPKYNNETKKITDVIAYFNFSEEEVREIRGKLRPNVIEKIKELYSNSFDPGFSKLIIENQIKRLSDYFHIGNSEIDKIKADYRIQLLNEFISNKLLTGRISPKDENDLQDKITELNLSHKPLSQIIQPKYLKQLKCNKLLWQIDNGLMEQQKGLPINLKALEVCFLALGAERIQLERKQSFSMSSGGVSFPLNKSLGLGLNIGRGSILPREEADLKYAKGTVYLTSNRVIFIAKATDKSFEVKYENLLSFNLYADGIELLVNQNNLNILLPADELEKFTLGLKSCLRNFNNPNNEILIKARKELSAFCIYLRL